MAYSKSLYRSKEFWKHINANQNNSADPVSVKLSELTSYFKNKLSKPNNKSNTISECDSFVETKHGEIKSILYDICVFSEFMLKRFIQNNNPGSAAGLDGLTTEHLNTQPIVN